MALKKIYKNYEKHRGVNDQLQNLKVIEDDHLVELTNFNYIPATEGRVQIETREGTEKDTMEVNLSGNYPINGIAFTEYLAGNETVFAHGDKLYRLEDTPVVISSGNAVTMNDFVYFGDRLLIFNDTDNPKELEKGGEPVLLSGSPPISAYAHIWHNHIFLGGIPDNKNRIKWSELGDRESYPIENQIDRPYGELMGINSLYDDFYIFFRNKIEKINGYATSEFVFSDFADIGCISHYGIVSNGSTLFFPTIDGIYAIGNLGSTDKTIGGTSLIKLMPDKIKEFWSTLDLSDNLIHGVHDPDRHLIRWSVRRAGESYNDRELVFNYHENVMGFAFHKGRYISCYVLGKDTSGGYDVKYGDSRNDGNGGMIYRLDNLETSDDGSIISGVCVTKAYTFGLPTIDKKYNTVSFLVKGEETETPLKISYGVGDYPDFSNTKQVETPVLPLWDDAEWDNGTWENDTFKNYTIGIRKMGKALVMKLVSDALNKRITIASWLIKALKFKDFKTHSDV